MADLPDMEQMNVEWQAWQGVCRELKAVHDALTGGVGEADLNGPGFDPLFRAVRRWGEELVCLRQGQEQSLVERALEESRAAYSELPDDG